MQEKKAKVTVISYTNEPLEVIAAAVRLCYSPKDIEGVLEHAWNIESQDDNKRLIKEVLRSGHGSVAEHPSITFGIEGISRACTHQLVRHRIASYSQQSQRYVEFKEGELPIIFPESIENNSTASKIRFRCAIEKVQKVYNRLIEEGVPAEDARFVLPNATETKIIVTMNFRALLNFFHERTCNRAQWEIRSVAMMMLEQAKNICPTVFDGAGPECYQTKQCKQGKRGCGQPWVSSCTSVKKGQ